MRKTNATIDSGNITAFHGGSFWEAIDYDPTNIRKLGVEVIPADVLDAWYPPSQAVTSALKENLERIIHTCPPTESIRLIQTISRVREIPEKNILCGTGSSQLIFLLLQLLLSKEDTALLLDPMYGEYEHVLKRLVGCAVQSHVLNPDHEFHISIPSLASDITKYKPRVAIIVNPNSPTGVSLTKTHIQELLATTPKETIIVLDETYIEYMGMTESCESLVANNSRLCVLKSMSKIYALSGLRIGYLVAPESIIKKLKAHIPPWSVSLPAQIAGAVALNQSEYYQKKIAETRRLRQNLFKELQLIPKLIPFPSMTNFILCKLGGIKASSIIAKLKNESIFLRNCDSMSEQFHNDFIRITVMHEFANRKIVAGLKKYLS